MLRSADPAGGGVAEWVSRLGQEQVRCGADVSVATVDDPEATWLRDYPLSIYPLGPAPTRYGYSPRLVPWLRHRTPSDDVVLVHGIWQYPSYAVWRVLAPTARPYVVFPHGMLDPWFKRRYPLKHLKKWLYWPWADYRVLRDAAAVVFTAEDERILARQSFWLYRCHEQVVPIGTPPPPEETLEQRPLFATTFPETNGKRIVLFLGRVHEKKGIDLLIRAFASALQVAPPQTRPWHLVLAGPAASREYRRRLDQLVQQEGLAERVTWTGMITGDLKWATIRAADALVLPSHQENFGIVVAEALACGVPALVSTRVNIWREVVADSAGFAEADTLDGTRRLLQRWMSADDETQSLMRTNARRCFAARFAVHDAAARLDSTLQDILR